jgi:hypothetical protein
MERVLQEERVFLPEYEGRSIVNVPSSILQFFGVRPPTPPLHESILPLEKYRGYKKAILFIFDSLGYHRFLSTGALKEFPAIPITSVCPSTTSSALTSLYTGVPPLAHGMVGFRLFLKELGLIVNMIKLSPAGFHERDRLLETGFDPTRFLQVKTIFQLLKKRNIKSFAFTKMHYYRSGLSSLMHKGAEILPYVNIVDLLININKLLKKSRGKVFITAYIDDFDIIAHYYGTHTEEEKGTILTFLRILKEIMLLNQERDTLILLTSDHGQVPSPPKAKVDISSYPKIIKNLTMPPTGEFRMSYFHLKHGCRESCMRELRTELARSFIVLTRDEALALKLYGDIKVPAKHTERLGDIILVSKGEKYLHYPYSDFELKARHGGLHMNEMLVPFINLSERRRQRMGH